MKKPTHNGLHLITVALLVGSLGLGNAAAQASGVVLKPMRTVRPGTIRVNQRMRVLRKHLSCKVWGTPVEFPDSVLLTNDGTAVIAAGTRVHYFVTRGGIPSGNYTFTKALRRGASTYASLPGGSARGAACTVRFVAAPTHLQVQRPQMAVGIRKTTVRRLPPPRQVIKRTMATPKPMRIARPRKPQIKGPLHTVRLAPMHLRCRTAGEGEFVNNVVLTNDRPRPILAGTKIHYAVNGQVYGNYTFKAPLNMNQYVLVKLSTYTAKNLSCSVAFLK